MPAMPNGVSGIGDVAKSNVRQYPYLPEWIDTPESARTVRRVLNPTDLYASSRLMVESVARAEGRRLSPRKKKRLTQAERRFAQGRMMLYSPLGRGSVVTDA